ncbi:MAG: hypothetical protein ACRD3J_08170 [Thermoanaerobaculia bacterium]
MSESVVAASLPRRKLVFVRTASVANQRRRASAVSVCMLVMLVSVVTLFLLKPDERLLAAPMLAVAMTTTVFTMLLWVRDGSPPVFEAGALCMFAIAVYGTLPMVGFLMMHGQWDIYADGRLMEYPFVPGELGAFGWRYAVYAIAFAATYLFVRGRAAVRTTAFTLPVPNTQRAIIIVFAALYVAKIALKAGYGYDPDNFDYTDPTTALVRIQEQSYFIMQIGHNILSALFVVQLAVIVLLLAHWKKRWCRYALVIWLGTEVLVTAISLGSRGRVVLLLISAGVLYHRLVKRLSFRLMVVCGSLLLTGFLILGAIRVVLPGDAMQQRAEHALTAGNEFQALFTTAFDIHKRKEAGQLDSVPWQVYVSDFYLEIPSQFLPFEKIDPSSWYIDLIGQTGAGVGYMFGVMSQAAVGFDWIELVVRGAVLAGCLALMHRWYVRRSRRFWPTLLYLFISIWAYYTFRASTFYFVYFVIYHFVPVFLATRLLEKLVSRVQGTKPRMPVSA